MSKQINWQNGGALQKLVHDNQGIAGVSKSDAGRDFVNVAGQRPYRASQLRAALHAAMGDLLKIIRFGSVIEPRGRDRGDRHPVSAMRAGEQESR